MRTEGISGPVSVGGPGHRNHRPGGNRFFPRERRWTSATGETAKSFDVSILDDKIVDGKPDDRLLLTPLPPGRPGNPGRQLIIVDNELSNIPAGSLDTEFLASGTDGFVRPGLAA